MSNAKFVEDWNDIFKYKIKESDLQKPTEAFVSNVLLDYLNKFNMDVAPLINLKNSSSADMRRAFKVKLCSYIDHLYKISCANNYFVYYDLIKPTPKKTTHMLKILLNYFLYVEMLRKETVTLAESALREEDRLINKKSNYLLEMETLKSKLDRTRKQIVKYNDILPKLVEQVANCVSKEKELADKTAQIQETIGNYDAALFQLKCKERELKCDIISEDEIKSLTTNKCLLEQAISEQEEIERVYLAESKDRIKAINKMQSAIEKITLTMQSYPVEDLNKLKEMKSKLMQISKEYTSQQALNEQKRHIVDTNMELMRKYEKVIQEKKDALLVKIEKTEEEARAIKRNIEKEQAITKNLNTELESLNKEIEKCNEYGNFLLLSAQRIVDILSRE